MHYPSGPERERIATRDGLVRVLAVAIVMGVAMLLLGNCPASAQQPCITRHNFGTPGFDRCVANNERERYRQQDAERISRQLQMEQMRRQMDYLQLQLDLQQLRCWGKC